MCYANEQGGRFATNARKTAQSIRVLAVVATVSVSAGCGAVSSQESVASLKRPAVTVSDSRMPAAKKTAVPPAQAVPSPASMAAPLQRFFGRASVYDKSVRGASIASNSAQTVSVLAGDARVKGAFVSYDIWNVSFYRVPAGTARVSVKFADCFASGGVPPVFTAAMSSVPIPVNAVPALGDDKALSIYDPSTDQLWEMWRAERTSAGWQACWGGRLDRVSSHPGYFANGTGAAGSGLAMAGSMVTMAEVKAGRINHAVSLVVPTVREKVMSYPAQRTDGVSTNPNAPMEGQRFRLDPSIDVNSLNLTPFAKLVARAAQEYGFIVVDQSGAVGVPTESGLAQKLATGVDPWHQLLSLDTTDRYALLDGFPWHRLQALPKDWGR